MAYVMSEGEANAAIDQAQADAQPTTVKRIAEMIAKGREQGRTDHDVAAEIAEFIFLAEPKSQSFDQL